MLEVNPQDFLDDQFPMAARRVVPTILNTAYSTIRKVVKDEPALQVQSAKQDLGRLMSYAVDRGFEIAIENGSLPFDYCWKDYARPTGKYLALQMTHSFATISLAKTPREQPRSVVFRETAKTLNSQLSLFRSSPDEIKVNGVPHILLLHGFWEPEYAHLGIPKADCNRDFSYRTENLFNLARLVESDGPPPEDTDTQFEDVELLKTEIDKWRRDNE